MQIWTKMKKCGLVEELKGFIFLEKAERCLVLHHTNKMKEKNLLN